MITSDMAWAIILRSVRPMGVTTENLPAALGRCLAENIKADRDLPPADRSAMDGFAVRAKDLAHPPARLRMIGEIAAGSPARPKVRPGTCARILTGANVPPGADTVVMVEFTKEENGHVLFSGSAIKGANILRQGEDTSRNAMLIPKSTILGSTSIACCAAVGKARVRVYRQPALAILCTGTELRAIDARVKSHETRNSNGPALAAALAEWGYRDTQVYAVADSRAGLCKLLRRVVANHEVVLLTGGMSVGKYDFVREALATIGADILFHGVAMKPGKPVLYAVLTRTTHIFGLPGNPLSAMTGFHEFALPAVRRMSGMPPDRCRPVLRLPLASRIKSKGGRTRFVLGRIEWRDSGPVLQAVKSQSSADVTAVAQAHGTIIVPAEVTTLAADALVDFRPWRRLP